MSKDQTKTRIGGSIWLGQKKVSAIWLFERGGSGNWNQLRLKYQLGKRVGVGYISDTFQGQDPRLDLSLGKTSNVWVARTQRVTILGVKQVF